MWKIPFDWLPSSWGLKGKSRQRAQAEYELSGLDLDQRLAEIDHDDPDAQAKAKLAARLKHKDIDQYQHDQELARLTLGDDELAIDLLRIDLSHNKISQADHDRRRADILAEPWVAMPQISWDPADPSRSFFELDYNDHFVAYLRAHGYNNGTDEAVVERWLNDICRSVAMDLAQTDSAFVTEAAPVTRKRRGPKNKPKTEYS